MNTAVIEYRSGGKRFVDVSVALVLLILTAPVWTLAAVGLAVQNRGSMFFIQERPGYKAQSFRILKFKTMTDAWDERGNLLPDNQLITRLGRIVRQWSIDELPQLINVIKGDMSLIGPRPLLFKYLPLYSQEQFRRHEVRPGITGWAQVNGRNAISWEEKFDMDVEYVVRQSFALDLLILWKTVGSVFARRGISAQWHATMEEFLGTEKR
jgi:undecaprenyl phosphate N,N'-diacetylbacillosamine 1-phosphate transferase